MNEQQQQKKMKFHSRLGLDWVGLNCRIKANCLPGRAEPKGVMSSVGVFLRDPSPNLRELRKNPQKIPNG